MAQEKDKWSNVVAYRQEDYLKREEYAALLQHIRLIWKKSAWLHLRLANDLDINTRSPMPIPELRKKILGIQKEMDQIVKQYLEKG